MDNSSMRNILRIICIILGLSLVQANAQTGQLQPGQVWGNPTSSQALPIPTDVGSLIDQKYACTAQGSILQRGASTWSCLHPGSTAGQILQSGGTGANLSYSTITLPTGSVSINELLYTSSASVVTGLATANSGVLITSAGGTPSISTTLPSGIAATNMSLTTPTIAGGALSGTFSGNATLSGNITHSGQLIETGASAPSSAAGNTVIMGTISAPTLSNNGQAFFYNTAVNGAVHQGQGSTYDITLADNVGSIALGVSTGTVNLVALGKIAAASISTTGTIGGSICRTSGGDFIYSSGVNCFTSGAATSLAPGTTTISPTTTNNLLYDNAGTLGEQTIAHFLAQGNGITITGTTTATIAQSLTNTSLQSSGSASNSASTVFTMAGLGSSCHITPTYSTRILVGFWGQISNNTTSDAFQYQLRFGTGTAPTAGTTGSPGTQIGVTTAGGGGTANANVNFALSIGGVVTGLTPGTAYWLDINYESIVGGTTSITTSCTAQEF
jgi:hypothetical protein